MITGLKPGWRRICLLLLLLAVPLLLPGWPIGGQQQPTMSVDVRVVNVFATVRNKHGEIVPNLTKDDFTLEEDGRPQAIPLFHSGDGSSSSLRSTPGRLHHKAECRRPFDASRARSRANC